MPYTGFGQQPLRPIHSARAEPEFELPRASGEPRTSWGDVDRISVAARNDRFAELYPPNSDEIRNAIQVSLWICLEIIIENNENISTAEVHLPITNMKRVPAGRHHLVMSNESFLERQLGPAIVAHQFIV